ncbi:MAG: ABC transporter ATP-binding protein, partial [Lentihominibacter sp.]|nr:ABC transporter ATP-binding protein [Lentihominibacter sp.]
YEKNAPDVLRSTSLGVQKGSFHAIVGGNGTGKSTMLKAICGICKPYRGNILINGKKLEKYKDGELFSSNLAMLPQDARSIFVKKTVREDLEEMTAGGDEGEAAIAEVAEICDISHLLDTHPYDLSGGEQQRAALAKVLLTRPQILLMDEPTKGMDSFFKRKFAGIIADLKSRGVTVLMVSHDVEFCAAYTDVVSMFFDGGIVTTDTPNSFFSRNSFYTTAANRMSRHIFANAINNEDVTELCIKNL